jgi:hypothetical protein
MSAGRARRIMPKVFTTCLVTGRPIDTGIDIDDGSFARLPDFAGKIFCPHCGTEHEWSKDNARVVDGETPKS